MVDTAHLRRDIRSGTNTSMGSEFLLIGWLCLSGFLGMYTEDVRVTFAVFFGGLVAYCIYVLPSIIKELRHATDKWSQGKAEASAKKAAYQANLPTADMTAALIAKRRSIFPKDFNGKRLSREQVEKLLEAANWAPTHSLTEPWRFVVLEGESKERFEDLTIQLVGDKVQPAEKAAETVAKMKQKKAKAWPQVSHYIAICMAQTKGKGGKPNPEWEEIASVGCAVQNMYLQATAMGVAGYWSSWQAIARDSEEMHAFLGLNPGDRCLGVFVAGFSDRADGYRGSRKPVADKVTWRS